MNHLDWLLGASALGVPPEGAIIPQSLLERDIDCNSHRGRGEGDLAVVLGRELGEGRAQVAMLGEARVLSPHPRPGLHLASLRHRHQRHPQPDRNL